MNENLNKIIRAAHVNQSQFTESVEMVKSAIAETITKSTDSEIARKKDFYKVSSTGWLRGSLSYPWVVLCTIIPAILESI